MTAQETRDALAEMDGWLRVVGVPGFLKEDGDMHLKWKLRHHEQWDHPHPPTLDGADAAIPEGWKWSRDTGDYWRAWTGWETSVEVPDTGDKIADLYALALECRRAMEEKR